MQENMQRKNLQKVIVEMATATLYDFVNVGETVSQATQRGVMHYQESLERVKRHVKDYGTDYWAEQMRQMTEKVKAGCKVMTYEEYTVLKGERLLSMPLKEITEDEWNDMFNVLEPLCWRTINGCEEFCIREMYTGTYTNQYAKKNGRYYTKMVNICDKNTWIHNYI